MKGETIKFVESGVRGVLRDVLLPWFNAFRFFTQQASRWEIKNSTGNKFTQDNDRVRKSQNIMDVWIMASLDSLVHFVHEEMRTYRLYTVVPRYSGCVRAPLPDPDTHSSFPVALLC